MGHGTTGGFLKLCVGVKMKGTRGKGGREGMAEIVLWHPSFSPTREGRSLANLKEEGPLLLALEGALAALAAVETAGWAGYPPFSAWTLDPEGLPRLVPSPEEATHPLAEHLQGFLALFGARPGKADGKPVLSRKHPHAAALGRWFGRHAWRGGDARGALLDLHEVLRGEGLVPALHPLWAFSGEWRPRPGLGGAGRAAILPPSPSCQGALALWCARRGVKRVVCETPSPYPFASLEPLVRECVGEGGDSPDAWLAARLNDPDTLATEFSRCLPPDSSGLWLDGPAAVDAASFEVLGKVVANLAGPLLVPASGASPAGEFSGLRALTLPPAVEGWFLGEALEVCGSVDAILGAYAVTGAALLVPGGSLLPPVPEGRVLSEPPAREQGRRGAPLWRYAAHLKKSGVPEAALWQSRAHLATGQARLALAALEGAPEGAEGRALLEARALDRTQDLKGMRRALETAPPLESLPEETAAEIRQLCGQAAWLTGEVETGIGMLEEAARLARQPDSELLATVALATAHLHQGAADVAGGLLEEAKRLLPKCAQPRAKILWMLRHALLQRRRGRYAEAAEGACRAAEIARDSGDYWNEAVASLDAGNALRLQFRFPEAREWLRKAEEGFWTLGLSVPREAARFDRMLCEVESGHLLLAQDFLEEALLRSVPSHDRIVERYWLARIFHLRGEPGRGLEQVRAALEEAARFPDPEVEAPLHNLHGRLLLEARETSRLGGALREVQSVFQSGSDPDDRLEAAALLLEASGLPRSPYTPPGPFSLLESLCREASPASRARWALARSRGGGPSPLEDLREVRALALESHDAGLEAEALLGLYQRDVLPPLSPEESWRVAAYLTENRVRGPLRDLLPALSLQKHPAAVPHESSHAPRSLDPIPLLERARRGGSSLAEVAEAAGAVAGLLLVPGSPSESWGPPSVPLRKELAEVAGAEVELGWKGHTLAGAVGRGGIRVSLAWKGAVSPPDGAALLRLWASLLPIPDLTQTASEAPRESDPILGRILVGISPAVLALHEKLRSAAPFSFPVLLTGEPGVGKEACAHALHEVTGGGRRPWIAANCANLSPTLAASLLFGHRKGAFTGADRDSQGLVEAAKGGTLFLDEIGELPPETQAQLLRYLQDGSYTPVGETRSRVSEARVVAATNRDLEGSVAKGSFRADLFHRLNVIRVEIPPLRQRAEDIPLLFRHFLEKAAAGEKRSVPAVDDPVWGRLSAYSWPGNVRELQNLARFCLVAASTRGRVAEADLPRPLLTSPRVPHRLQEARDLAEKPLLTQALNRSGGNLSAAARELGMTRQGLARKLKALGIGTRGEKGT